ncbi:MAG: ABC transporter ATP-binding protein, partial [Calditrichaeota bacterium]|nr:ABC transporter ATP-binding protein [Calditrichota bacterium]
QAFRALDDISFRIEKGQSVGIIGVNGSGKSTLLKLICGVLQPSGGELAVNGRIAALLELGAGFNLEFSGRENVYMNGALMGLSREEMDRCFPEIEAFAGIGAFIDQPVKTYSSGMFVRLAFAAAVNVDPDILVVDEALSVGDIFFQHKCIARIEEFQNRGKTILFVTHDINLVKSVCNHVVLLDHGRMLAQGDPEEVTEHYLLLARQRQTEYAEQEFRVRRKSESKLQEASISFGSDAGQIREVQVLDAQSRETSAFLCGTSITIRIRARVGTSVRRPSISIILRDQRGYNLYGTSTAMQGQILRPDSEGRVTVNFKFSPQLREGSYSLVVSLDDFLTPKVHTLLDRQVGVGAFQVIEGPTPFLGIVDLKAQAHQEQVSLPEAQG